jgi:hypothetical protein
VVIDQSFWLRFPALPDFYFGVLHPVVRALSRLSEEPSLLRKAVLPITLLPDFLRSSGSGTGSTQTGEYN